MAVSFYENWQARKSVLECNKYMFDNQLCCDVNFKVGESDNCISAHKYVLASRSSVYAAMFFGSLPESSDVIAVSDIEPDVFDILMRFLYYDDVQVSETTVVGTLYAAEKYNVLELADHCRRFLESNITEETVLHIMENVLIFNMSDLFSKCLCFIDESRSSATNIFNSSEFLQCSRECLLSLVKSDDLPLDEEIIYLTLVRWAKQKCKLEGMHENDSKETRKVLGTLIYHVRFSQMPPETFWKITRDGILTPHEISQISQHFAGNVIENFIFTTTKRTKLVCISRVLKDSKNCIWNQLGDIDAVDFEVNKPLLLHGIHLYGSVEIPYSYDVEVKVISRTNTVLLHIHKNSVKKCKEMFEIGFDQPCQITPNEVYTLWVKMTGPQSF